MPPKAFDGLFSQQQDFLTTHDMVLSFWTPFLSERLQDLAGLLFILVQDVNSSILFSSLYVHGQAKKKELCHTIVDELVWH